MGEHGDDDDDDELVALATAPLGTRWVGRPLVLRHETGSTNDDVRAAAQAGAPTGYTVLADAQRAGRGRRGRAWHSPPGESLYVSVLLRPRLAPADAPVIALAAALAVCDAVATVLPSDRVLTIKWPNDVRVDGRKVAGVLVEGALRGAALAHAVVGIGLNVRGRALPEELAASATTLRLARGGADLSRVPVALALLVGLEARLDALAQPGGAADAIAAVAARCDTLGRRVAIDEVAGVAESIAPSGALCVRRDDGELVEVRAGEVVHARAADEPPA